MSIQVVPTPLTTVIPTIYSFNYNVNNFQLNSSITFNVILLDQNATPLQVSQVTLAGDDYQNWGNNDQYVITYICNSLGLTQFNPPSTSSSVPVVPAPAPAPAPADPAPADPAPVDPTTV